METAIIKPSLYARHCISLFLFNVVINHLINYLLFQRKQSMKLEW